MSVGAGMILANGRAAEFGGRNGGVPGGTRGVSRRGAGLVKEYAGGSFATERTEVNVNVVPLKEEIRKT